MVKFFGVRELLGLLQILGVEEFLSNLIRYTRDDYLRWQQFEKIARVASHSPNGVIELMRAGRVSGLFRRLERRSVHRHLSQQCV